MKMQGLSLEGMKKHPALIPLFVVLGFGVATAVSYTIRSATKNPDVSWSNKNKPEPWNDYRDKNFKFLNPGEGMTKMERPKNGSIWS